MTDEELKRIWKSEESCAFIKGWDFSHIHGRYTEEDNLPWDYEMIIRSYLKDEMKLLDYDTGGGEFLLSLQHPYENTAATEGYSPNVALCKERLIPLGIDLRECKNAENIPFEDEAFDIIINRHGDFYAPEIKRLLKPGGIFITEQVGGDNDKELVEMVLPGTKAPHPELNLKTQQAVFENAGFQIIKAEEAFRPIRFFDIGAFVWFARIIEWEFPSFSVDNCFDKLLKMQETLEREGAVEGTIHRYLIVARKALHSEQDLKKASEYRSEIHCEALAKVKAVYPCADKIVDNYSADDYFQQVWDYPGKWYTIVGTPPGAGSRKKLVETLVRQTLEYYKNNGIDYKDDEFYRVIEKYPDIACDYCIVNAENQNAKESGVFPYRGVDSHRLALEIAAGELFDNGAEWSYDMKGASCRKLSSKALFAPVDSDKWLNYRRAFCCPPYGISFSDDDFEKVNSVLFPGGTDELEVFRWSTDWSDYFDDGHEWWGALCLTVYDKTLQRFVIIMASTTD